MKNKCKHLICFASLLAGSLLFSISTDQKEALAGCNSGWGKLDPTCPGRLLNPRLNTTKDQSQPPKPIIDEQMYNQQTNTGNPPLSPECQKTLRQIDSMYPPGSDDNRELRSSYPQCNFN